MQEFPLFPDRASAIAGRVDLLYFALIGLTIFFASGICVSIIYFGVKYRRGSSASRANQVNHSTKVEVAWVLGPLAIVMVLFGWAINLYFDMYNPPRDSSEIYVVGKQWMWKLQHPDGRREINELHVPLGRPVRLNMISQDVIHSFYVPAFRVKQDVLPGRYTSLWFQPDRVGKYHLFCAEYCGTNHSVMGGWVTVMDPSEYDRWLEQGNVQESMAITGAALFRQHGCSGCHVSGGVGRAPVFAKTPGKAGVEETVPAGSTIRAPVLEGIYGTQVPIQEGTSKDVKFVTVDDRYVRDSIRLPNSQIAAGYEPLMPTFHEGQISEDEVLQIIAYIKSLGQQRDRKAEQR